MNATIKGGIVSVKNPENGRIAADSIGEIVITKDSRRRVGAEIYSGGKLVYPAK